MRAALFGGAADLVGGGGKALFWPEEKAQARARARAPLEPRSVLDCTRSPSPNNSTSTLSSSLGGGAADSAGAVAVVSDSSIIAAAAAAGATKWGAAPGQHGKEDWAGGCELPPIPAGLDMGGGGESWDAVLGSAAAAAGQDQTFLNWIIGAAGDLDQPGPPLPVHQQPLLDNVGFGFPAADPLGLGFSLDPHLGGVGSDMSSSPGALSHATNSGSKASSAAFGLFSPESAPLQPPPPPVLFHEGIDTKPPLLGAQPPPGLLHQYQQHQPTPAATFFMPIPSFPDHNQQSPLLQPPPKRHQSIGDDLYLARNRLLQAPPAGQGHAFPPLNGPAPFHLQPSAPPPHGAMKTTAAEAAQQQLLDELSAAAKAAEAGNSIGAREILARLNHQLPPLGKPFLRSASYLKEALLLALAEGNHHGGCHLTSPLDVALKLVAYKTFSDHSPVLQFTNFTATQALLDEIAGSTSSCIHVIDFDLGVGGQWASFLQELAHRRGAGGAAMPFVKLTAIVSAASHHPLELRLARDNIAQFAADLGIPFEFNAISADMINPAELITGDEVVAVVLPAGCSARAPPLPVILRLVKQLAPKIVIAIDHGADHADLPFSQHFLSCFQSCVFLLDSLDATGIDADSAGKIEKFLIQPRIEDSVLGRGKVDKPIAWRSAFAAAGFVPVPPSNLAEAQADCLLKRVQVRGFHVEKCGIGLTLYWQRGELVTVSAWRC